MFLENKYKKWYDSIITKAKIENRTKGIIYYESHHIIPRSLGGNNKKENLILLTAKEHFLCHLLLVKFTSGDYKRKMAWAMWNLANVPGNIKQHRFKLSSKTYSFVRNMYGEAIKGVRQSEETKAKRRISCKKNAAPRFGKDNNEFTGYYHTPWGKFITTYEASKKCPYGLQRKRIPICCKQNDLKFQIRKPITIPLDWVGKTYKELGFWFEPMETINKSKKDT